MARVDVGVIFRVSGNMAQGLARMRGQMDRTTKSAKRMRAGFGGLGRSIALLGGVAIIGQATKSFVKMGAEMQNLRVRIGTFTRDSALANATFRKMRDQFKEVPFDLSTLGDSLVRLKASGLDPLDGSLKAIVDGVAAFGGGSQELRRATIAIQQMAGKGVISMEEMRQQLGEAIPFAMKVMASQMKISVAELISDIERGNLEASIGIRALTDGLATFFGGTADIMVNTMSGAFERIKKSVQSAADTIFNEFNIGTQIALLMQDAAVAIDTFIAGLTKREVQDFFNALLGIGEAILKIGKAVGTVLAAISTAISSFVNNVPFGAEILVIGGAGLIGFILFGGPIGAFVAAAVAGTALAVGSINGELDKIDKGGDIQLGGVLTQLPGLGTGGGGGLGDDLKASGKVVDDELGRQATALEKRAEERKRAIEKFQESLTQLITIETFTKSGQTAVAKLDRTLESLQAKLRAAGTLPFLGEIEKFTIQAADLDTELARARENVDKLATKMKEANVRGDAEAVALLREKWEIANASVGRVAANVGLLRQRTEELRQSGLDKIADKIDQRMTKLAETFKVRGAKLTGDLFGNDEALAKIEKFHADIRIQLEKDLKIAQELAAEDSTRAGLVADINAQIAQGAALRRAEIDDQKQLNKLKIEQLRLETQNQNAQIARDIAGDLRELQSFQGGGFSFFAPEEVERARAMREELVATTEQLREQIKDIMVGAEGRRALTAEEQQQITLLQQRIGVMKQLSLEMTATGLATRDMWEEVANTIKGTLEDSIIGILTQTGTMRERINDMFASITEAAARYIAKLLIIKALEASAGGGGGFAGLASVFLGGSAKGNAFKGSIKPFAKGGVIGGPTMFGLAGEAGPEAIMPLSRGRDGKLGVAGGAGGGMSLTIQAIDPQTGTQFVLDHIGDIETGVRNQKALGIAR